MFYKQEVGQDGENYAVEYLKNEGYNIIQRNFRCKQGEIDIIAREKDEIVFVEVKTRSTSNYGAPSEAVDEPKQKHIIKATEYYIHINNLYSNYIRFDVIEVMKKGEKYEINHIKQAIGY